MLYKFTDKEDYLFLYEFYFVYFVKMKTKLSSIWANTITKEQALELKRKTIKKSRREEKFKNSLIAKMVDCVKPISRDRKNIYEIYDLMILLMDYLGKDKLSMTDFEKLDIKDFYVKYIKVRYDILLEYEEKILSLPADASRERLILLKEQSVLRKHLIPTEEEYLLNSNNKTC